MNSAADIWEKTKKIMEQTMSAVAIDTWFGDVEAIALDNKISAAYQEAVAAWVAEANVEYFYENFGVNVQ